MDTQIPALLYMRISALNKKFFQSYNYSYLRAFTKISFLYATTLRYFTLGFLFSPFLITVFLLFQFTFREVGVSSASMVSSICLGVITSELLLFVSFFWGVYTSLLSPSYISDSTLLSPTEGLVSLSSCGLIVTITFLLSTASVLLGYGVITCEKAITRSNMRGFLAIVLTALCFTSIQVCEYLGLTFYINDSALGTYFLILTGLHFSHVVVGAVLLLYSFWRGSMLFKQDKSLRVYTSSSVMVLPMFESTVLLYWHFVEAVWLVIHATFYTL